MKNKMLVLFPLIFCLTFLAACGMPEEEKQIQEMVKGEYSEIITSSKIVDPYAVINSFNNDLDRALANFNSKRLAIRISPSDILSGTLVIPNSDGTQTKEECYYVQFDESGWIIDEKEQEKYKKENPSRTSFICSINPEYIKYLQYMTPSEHGTKVSSFFLVGSLSAIVGNDRYNLFAKDCMLVPASELYSIEVPAAPEVEQSKTLDVSSSEDITFTITNLYKGYLDYDLNGLTDVLNIAFQNALPSSSFEKIVDNNLLKNISTDLSSVVKISYDSRGNEISYSFKLNYPNTVETPELITSSGLDGSFVNVLNFPVTGRNKGDLNYFDNKEKFNNAFPVLLSNPLALESRNSLLSVTPDSIQPFQVKLLDGTTTDTVSNDKVLFKSIAIDALGNVTGDIFVKTNNPCAHYYKSQFKIIDNYTLEEVKIDTHDFYSVEKFEDYDIFEVGKTGFKLKKDIAVATEKKIFVSYKLESKSEKNLNTGIGKTKEEDTVRIIKCNTGDYINFLSVEKIGDQYWLNAEYLYGEGQKKTCFIPILINSTIVSSDRNIQVLGTSYKLDDLFYFGN